VLKLFMSAPLTTVGLRPAWWRIDASIPVTVLLPLVPATPIRVGAALNRLLSSSARVMAAAPIRRAAMTSGMVSSTAAEVTRIWSGDVIPLPSCGCSGTPRARRKSNLAAVRPWSSARSEPSTRAPRACMTRARGSMPLPPIPQKK
jgi:hypothetical protein